MRRNRNSCPRSNRVPGGAAGSSSGQGLSDPRESRWDPHDDRADPSGRRGTFLKSRVSVGNASSDDADDSIGTVEPPSAPTTGNSERERKGRLGAQRIPMSGVLEQSLKWWTSEEALQTGSVFHLPFPVHTIFTDASLEGWGVAF